MLRIIIFTLSVVSGRRITDEVRDEILGKPAFDFGTESSRRDGGVKLNSDVGHGSRVFSPVQRHQINPSGNIHGYQGFDHTQSDFSNQGEFQTNTGLVNRRDSGNRFHQNSNDRSSHGIEDFGQSSVLEQFDSQTQVHGRSTESRNHKSIDDFHKNTSGHGSNRKFQGHTHEFGSGNFESHDSNSRSSESHRTVDKTFQNSNVHSDHETGTFSTHAGDGHLSNQRIENKDKLDVMPAANKRTIENEPTNIQTSNIETNRKQDNVGLVNENVKTNLNSGRQQTSNTRSIHPEAFTNPQRSHKESINDSYEADIDPRHSMSNIDNTRDGDPEGSNANKGYSRDSDPRYTDTNHQAPASSYSRDNDPRYTDTSNANSNFNNHDHDRDSNARNNQRPKVTVDNEVLTNQNTPNIVEDKWTMDSNGVRKTTIIPETVTLDDRAAFNGDKCPTGKVKIGTMCVDID